MDRKKENISIKKQKKEWNTGKLDFTHTYLKDFEINDIIMVDNIIIERHHYNSKYVYDWRDYNEQFNMEYGVLANNLERFNIFQIKLKDEFYNITHESWKEIPFDFTNGHLQISNKEQARDYFRRNYRGSLGYTDPVSYLSSYYEIYLRSPSRLYMIFGVRFCSNIAYSSGDFHIISYMEKLDINVIE